MNNQFQLFHARNNQNNYENFLVDLFRIRIIDKIIVPYKIHCRRQNYKKKEFVNVSNHYLEKAANQCLTMFHHFVFCQIPQLTKLSQEMQLTGKNQVCIFGT